MLDYLLIIIAFGLVLLNGFFVAAEFGMVKLRHTRVATIQHSYGLRGKILLKIHTQLDAYLSACQLGITLASLGLGWVGEPAFAHILEGPLKLMGVDSPELITLIAYITAFAFITFLHIVIGELVPKSMAIRQSERISVWTALPLYIFYWLMFPAIWILNNCANGILKILGLAESSKTEHAYSSKEIQQILHLSHLHGEFSKEESRILEHTLDLAELPITAVMRPAEEMIVVNLQATLQENMKVMLKHRYTRYPVYDREKNKIVGIIHIKDLFEPAYKQELKELSSWLRPILKIPHDFPALELLKKFRRGKTHYALVYSDQETIIGFVTLDNLLHVLFGRIKDEFHLTQDEWRTNEDGSFTFSGNSSIYSLERALNIDIATEEEIDTLTGYIMSVLDRIPHTGEHLEQNNFRIIIEKMEGTKILQVRVYPKKKLRRKNSKRK